MDLHKNFRRILLWLNLALPGPDLLVGQTQPFQASYITLSGVRNYPASFSEERFDGGRATTFLSYRHVLDGRWIMTVGGGFKSLYHEKRQSMLPLLTLAHEAGWIVRLYHPTYLVLGPKLLYMVPATKPGLPLERDEEYGAEFGVGGGAMIFHLFGPKWAVHLGADRWRGTVTSIFHGIEVAAGVNFGIGPVRGTR